MIDTSVNSNDSPLALESQVCFALYSTTLAMTKLYRKLLRELNLTYPQYLVMLVLWQNDRRSVSEIGGLLSLDSATLTPLLKRLEKAGLITRQRVRQDERQVEVSLTQSGHELRQRAETVPGAVVCASQCTPAELQQLKAQLLNLRGKLLGADL